LIRELAALLFELYGFCNSSGSLAIFAAIRHASSLLSSFAAGGDRACFQSRVSVARLGATLSSAAYL
jgi:hypothetical protein